MPFTFTKHVDRTSNYVRFGTRVNINFYSRFCCDLLDSGRGVEGFYVSIANHDITRMVRLTGAILAHEDAI